VSNSVVIDESLTDLFAKSDDKFVMVGRNGAPLRYYGLGAIAKADLVLNEAQCFGRGGNEVADDWNHIQATCKGDWFSFMQFDGEWVEVFVVFADDADAEAFEASWGAGA